MKSLQRAVGDHGFGLPRFRLLTSQPRSSRIPGSVLLLWQLWSLSPAGVRCPNSCIKSVPRTEGSEKIRDVPLVGACRNIHLPRGRYVGYASGEKFCNRTHLVARVGSSWFGQRFTESLSLSEVQAAHAYEIGIAQKAETWRCRKSGCPWAYYNFSIYKKESHVALRVDSYSPPFVVTSIDVAS